MSERAHQVARQAGPLPDADSAGAGPGSTPDWVRQATVDAMQHHRCDHYTRRPGLAALCQKVAEMLAGRGIDVDPDTGVLITGSRQEARFVSLRSLAPGKTVFVPGPVPPTYGAAIDFGGATAHPIDPHGDLPVTSRGLLVIPTPHHVSGRTLDPATFERLAGWAMAADMILVADHTEAGPMTSETSLRAVAALPEMAPRTVILGSFATPGLSAWQVSWVAGPANLVTTVRDMKQAMTICTPAPGQYAALAGFQDRDPKSGQGE